MKKNLISIIILAVLIANIVLTGIMMFSVTSTANKTSKLIGDIAMVLSLEIGTSTETGEVEEVKVSMEDSKTYALAEEMTIPLKKGESGEVNYALVTASFGMDSKHDGYKTYGETIAEHEKVIRAEVNNVISSYTLDELVTDQKSIENEILKNLQALFESEFIYKVYLETIFQ